MLTQIKTPRTRAAQIQLYLLEDSQNPPVIRGNKLYKLCDNLSAARAQGCTSVLSFGGAYSNHLHALAWLAKERGMHSVGVVRGNENYADNPTLTDAARWGMQLEFVTRAEYRQRHDKGWLVQLLQRYPNCYLLPEGGANAQAISACGQLLGSVSHDLLAKTDVVACAIGTGATACGIKLALEAGQTLRGYAVVSDKNRAGQMQHWLADAADNAAQLQLAELLTPRFGKLDNSLCEFIDRFFCDTGVLLDPLYTGKMMRGIMLDIDTGAIPAGSTVVAVHTGGLQAWRGFLPVCESTLSKSTLAAIQQHAILLSHA